MINEFLAEGKYVAGLCNAVSVLAWARVDGKSPLQGKRVCAPTREAAAGIYNGRQAQPSCRWHPEANGAILSPAGAIGDPAPTGTTCWSMDRSSRARTTRPPAKWAASWPNCCEAHEHRIEWQVTSDQVTSDQVTKDQVTKTKD